MKMPGWERAFVPEEKITQYLLDPSHHEGKHKAGFFTTFGYTIERWQDLSQALLAHAANHDMTKQLQTGFGLKFVIEGPLPSPDGRSPVVRSVWCIDDGADAPRLVTAYPL